MLLFFRDNPDGSRVPAQFMVKMLGSSATAEMRISWALVLNAGESNPAAKEIRTEQQSGETEEGQG